MIKVGKVIYEQENGRLERDIFRFEKEFRKGTNHKS